MRNGVITISQKELTRYAVLRRVLDGTISLKDASGYMGVSYRQAKRLKHRAENGVVGLVHGNRGRSPANRVNEQLQAKILELSQGDYKGFNDTHFTEELAKLGIELSRESVRALRRSVGIVPKREEAQKAS